MKNYYDVLGVNKNVSSNDIKKTVKSKIIDLKKVNKSNDEKKKILNEYEEAYRFLSDYHKRRQLDEYLESNCANRSLSIFDDNSLSLFNEPIFNSIFMPPMIINDLDNFKDAKGSFYSHISTTTTRNDNGKIVTDEKVTTNNNGKEESYHKLITRDKNGNEIVKQIPIKNKKSKKYNI